MLVIKTIKLSGNSSLKLRKLTKVRVGYGDHVCTNQKLGRLIQQQIIEWKQDMILPLIHRKCLQFQFYPKHEFGYNPEEISLTCYAKTTIQNYKKNNMQAHVVNCLGETVGRVYFQYQLINIQKKKTQSETTCKISVSSILAHFDKYYGEKGYFQISIINQTSMTPQIKLVAGELLWTEKLIVPVQQAISQKQLLFIRVFVDDQLIGKTSIVFKQIKQRAERFKKLPLLSYNLDQKCGMIFIDINYNEKKIEKLQQKVKNKNYKSSSILPLINNKARYDQAINLKYTYSNKRLLTNNTTRASRISKGTNQNYQTKPTLNELYLYKLGLYNKNTKNIK